MGMKPTWTVRAAAWLLEHASMSYAAEAVVGDLLEGLHRGKTVSWFWRQAAETLAVGAARASLRWTPAMVFAAGWSLLYPEWRTAIGHWLPGAVPEPWLTLAWPRPALLELAYGVAPAVSFVWLGVLTYLVVRRDAVRRLTPARALGGLSASLNVILVGTWALLNHLQHPDLVSVTNTRFFLGFRVLGVSLPLALSVLVALLSMASPRARRTRGVAVRMKQENTAPHSLGMHEWLELKGAASQSLAMR
jgi:hypothetical protein